MWTAEEVELTKCYLLNTPQGAGCPEDGSAINYLFICVFIYLLFSDTVGHIKQCRLTG